MEASVVREANELTPNLDGIDPPYTLFAGETSPFASDRRLIAAVVCDHGLSE